MSGTALALAIDGLVATYTSVAADAAAGGVTVIDGEPKDPPPQHLCVGWDGPDEAAATSQPVPADAGWSTVDDTCRVGCWLSFWHGTKTVSEIRAALVAAFGVFNAALHAGPVIAEQFEQPSASGLSYLVDRVSREGTIVVLRWTVTIRAIVPAA